MTKGDREKHGDAVLEVVAEGNGQRVLRTTSTPFFGFGSDQIADVLGSVLTRGRIVGVVAPDHSGVAQGIVIIQEMPETRGK